MQNIDLNIIESICAEIPGLRTVFFNFGGSGSQSSNPGSELLIEINVMVSDMDS